MKNILYLMDYAAPYRGNFIESIENLRVKLNQLGSNVIYVFPEIAKNNNAISWINELKNNGCIVYFYEKNIVYNVFLLIRLVRKYNISIIHLHFSNLKEDFSVYLLTIFIKTSIIRHFHNHFNLVSRIKKIFKIYIAKKWTLICVSKSVFHSVKSVFPNNKCYSIDNSINYQRLDIYKPLLRSEIGVMNDEYLCFMLGFDFKRKGVDLAIKAISEIQKKNNIHLMISVSSNVESVRRSITDIFEEIPKWISIIPPRNDIASYYNIADLFLSPSREEGFCYALVEAAYCKKIIVASKIPAQGDLKIPNVFWFQSENIKKFKEAIIDAIGHKDSYSAELQNAKISVLEHYDIERWSNEIIDIYDKLST